MPPSTSATSASASASDAKLTKAQRKALQFKQQRKSKHEPDGGDLPQADEGPEGDPEMQSVKGHVKGSSLKDSKVKGKSTSEEAVTASASIAPAVETGSKKRKRAAAESETAEADTVEVTSAAPSNKKSKGKGKGKDDTNAAAETKGAKEPKPSKANGKSVKGAASKTKKVFDEEGNEMEVDVADEGGKEGKDAGKGAEEEKASRYILFVGNMSFKTTATTLTKHFAEHCHESPTVRLLTTKADSGASASSLPKSKQKSIAKGKALDPGAARSKGCAFVEFKTSSALRKALTFHHSLLEGRQINVELTAGGGGKSSSRQDKIKKKNEKLDEERRKLHEKYVKPEEEKRRKAAEARAKLEGGEAVAGAGGEKKGWGRMGKDGRAPTKVPRWMATGANATKLQG